MGFLAGGSQWEPDMSLTPQQDISTLVKMRRAIRARRPPAALRQRKPPVTLLDRKTLREEAAARWDVVSFTIAKRMGAETLPKVFEEGTTIGDRKALQQLFREIVRCCFLKD